MKHTFFEKYSCNLFEYYQGLRGATVARLTPDQKVACSNHVGVKRFSFYINLIFNSKYTFLYILTLSASF